MSSVIFQAMSNELIKIAEEATAVGRLVNADVGKNQFPDSDVGGKNTEKKQNRGPTPSIVSSSPDSESHTPESTSGSGGFTYN